MIVLEKPNPEISRLLKAATAAKKTDIDIAIKYIIEALEIHKSENTCIDIPIIKKLADYERLRGNFIKSVKILQSTYRQIVEGEELVMKATYMSLIVSYVATLCRKEKRDGSAFETLGSQLWALGLASQGRLKNLIENNSFSDSEDFLTFITEEEKKLFFIDTLIKENLWKYDDEIITGHLLKTDHLLKTRMTDETLIIDSTAIMMDFLWTTNTKFQSTYTELEKQFVSRIDVAFTILCKAIKNE
ncbi:hypothetical protein [Candidatus Puniceispirillum marinum]|uniref:Phosphonate ABC transporter, permease component n=1 Tax=Puniceispirillum marinum (strain IMCC1322) TaxID=488538 RepID=D5BNQ6_PUNMI|nr:hypothetical protein [Candidatus Puniceispirillum marinum]ADE38323.1 phosphonate ABC transporter, permease component [Candidatus Puniceispirillum marinum IMCC1322]